MKTSQGDSCIINQLSLTSNPVIVIVLVDRGFIHPSLINAFLFVSTVSGSVPHSIIIAFSSSVFR